MVLNDLGVAITGALSRMSGATLVDAEVLDACLKDIAKALLQADVKVQYVKELRDNVKRQVSLEELAAGHNKRKMIERAVFSELVRMVDAGRRPYEPVAKKCSVFMFVGLQGNGKTTTVAKYAYHYKRQGWRCAMVCADTYRAGAFDQLKQNATKARIPFYGSYTETDPVTIAREGVERFRREKKDIILVDTSGRHKQSEALFEEMKQVADAVDPDSVVFVMDSAMGQAAYDQAKAFHDSIDVGTVVLTKMDGHAKGGGALSAVAATRSPIAFIGVGEHIDEFEPFEPESFVQRLLGLGDVKGLLKKITTAMSDEQQEDMMEQMQEGAFPLRLLYDQFNGILSMGPMASMMSVDVTPSLTHSLARSLARSLTHSLPPALAQVDAPRDGPADGGEGRQPRPREHQKVDGHHGLHEQLRARQPGLPAEPQAPERAEPRAAHLPRQRPQPARPRGAAHAVPHDGRARQGDERQHEGGGEAGVVCLKSYLKSC